MMTSKTLTPAAAARNVQKVYAVYRADLTGKFSGAYPDEIAAAIADQFADYGYDPRALSGDLDSVMVSSRLPGVPRPLTEAIAAEMYLESLERLESRVALMKAALRARRADDRNKVWPAGPFNI
jgi:hypothetical protein